MSNIDKLAAARAAALEPSVARDRIAMLFDQNSFVELGALSRSGDSPCGVVCGWGAVMGSPVYAFAQDPARQSGALDTASCAKIKRIYELALKTGAPVVGIYDSHGAKISQGLDALDAIGAILALASEISGVIPQLAVVPGVCAGSSAMLACGADFVIMGENAEFFLSPPTGEENGGSAAQAAKSGVAHIVCAQDKQCFDAARALLTKLPLNNLSPQPVAEFTEPDASYLLEAAAASDADPEKLVGAVLDSESAVELLDKFGNGVYAAFGTIGGYPCGIIATRGEKLDGDDCAKIAKLVSVWDGFGIPVITLVNAPGFKASADQAVRDSARLAHVYAQATAAKISVVTGAAYGPAYIALAGRGAGPDRTLAWPTATLSALEPRTAVEFLYSDRITKELTRDMLEQEYVTGEASAVAAASNGNIDDVIEPAGTRAALLSALELLIAKRVPTQARKHSNIPM